MKKRILKILFWFVAVLLLLSGLVLILVRLPAVQTYLAQRATAIISNKLGTKVSIEKVRISFFREADFVNFYLEDLNHDTLIYAHELQVTIDAFDLLEKKLTVRSIGLDNGDVFIHRDSTGKHTNITEVFGKLKGDTVTDDYIKAVNNTISAALSVTDFKYAEELIEHLVEIRFDSRQMNQENNIRYTHLKQFLLWRTGKHSAGVTFSEQMINRHRIIELFPFQWSKVMMIVMMKALFEFSEKKHKQAIQTLLFFQPALTDKYGIETKKSILFLQLLIQFEIGNYTYIAPMVTSIKNRIDDLSEQEKLFLKNFARHYNNPTTLYNNLLQQCDKVIIRPLLSIKNWAMHKQQKVTLSNIILQHPLE